MASVGQGVIFYAVELSRSSTYPEPTKSQSSIIVRLPVLQHACCNSVTYNLHSVLDLDVDSRATKISVWV